MDEPKQPNGWQPPIPLGSERLVCAWCDWSAPKRYRNQSDKPDAEPRDGMTRLYGHARAQHQYDVIRAFQRAKRAGERNARPYLRQDD